MTHDWTGHLSRTDVIIGKLTCSFTGWKLTLTGTPDGKNIIHLTGQFDGETISDDAPPWTDEADIARPHEAKALGYDGLWVGTIRADDAQCWAGELGDFYGGRLVLTGKRQGPGALTLRAVARVTQEVRR